MHDRHRKERIRRLHNTGQHIIPCDESSNHAEHAARPRQTDVWVSVCGVGCIEVRGSQADERDPYHCEQRAEGERGFEGQEPEEEGEDEPGEDLVMVSFGLGRIPVERVGY